MTGGPRFDAYRWRGGRETMLRFGPEDGRTVIAALPLFEEANRTRAFMVAILTALADRGIGGVLPDLPGQGESIVPLESVSLEDWRTAFAAAADSVSARIYGIAIRSGALIADGTALTARWCFAPQDGAALARELTRIKQAAGTSGAIEIAGNRIAPALLEALSNAHFPAPDRTVRLATDPAPADRTFDGPALWRRSEPGNDEALAHGLADDIADWIATCEG